MNINNYKTPLSTSVKENKFEWGSRTYVMGIINLTPDSFSGDGLAQNPKVDEQIALAVKQSEQFADDGASILDLGGESTRPGAPSVDSVEERHRVIPAIQAISQVSALPISIDTQKAAVAKAAVEAGASIINDIWGLQGDPDMAKVVADYGTTVVVMHNKNTPGYRNIMEEMIAFLEHSLEIALQHGISREKVWIDPGIGFGKTREENLTVLHRLDELKILGQPILLGTSRKSVIGLTLNLPVEERLEGTAATVALGIAKGADIVRVHDVRAMARTAKMSDAIVRQSFKEGETAVWNF